MCCYSGVWCVMQVKLGAMDLWSWSCRYLESVLLLSVTETTPSPSSRGNFLPLSVRLEDWEMMSLLIPMSLITRFILLIDCLAPYFSSALPNCDGKSKFHRICRRDLSTGWASSLAKRGPIGGGHGRFPSSPPTKGQIVDYDVDIYLSPSSHRTFADYRGKIVFPKVVGTHPRVVHTLCTSFGLDSIGGQELTPPIQNSLSSFIRQPNTH
jgi:hypothetical protein